MSYLHFVRKEAATDTECSSVKKSRRDAQQLFEIPLKYVKPYYSAKAIPYSQSIKFHAI